MKKLIIAYMLIAFSAQAQDLSWGVGANFGLAGVTNDLDNFSVNKNQFYSIRPYLNYRIYNNLRVQLELPLFSLNSRFTTSDAVWTRYNYFNDYWDYYYDNCYVNTSFQRKKYYFSPSLLLEYRIKNLSLSVGAAFNIFDFGKGSEIIDGSVDHWNQQWGYEPSFSNDVIISSTISNSYTYLPTISPVFGLSYHLNSLEIGYRYTIGKHQISLGYDIGRYRYE